MFLIRPHYKIADAADLSTACLLGCGVSTGYGAAINTAKVTEINFCNIIIITLIRNHVCSIFKNALSILF